MNLERVEFEIILRPVPGNWRTPLLLRLRALLKAALRGYGFRAVACRPVQEAERSSGHARGKTDRGQASRARASVTSNRGAQGQQAAGMVEARPPPHRHLSAAPCPLAAPRLHPGDMPA